MAIPRVRDIAFLVQVFARVVGAGYAVGVVEAYSYCRECAANKSLVVQSLGYMTLNYEIRVQFPVREPCFDSLSLLFLYVSGYRLRPRISRS